MAWWYPAYGTGYWWPWLFWWGWGRGRGRGWCWWLFWLPLLSQYWPQYFPPLPWPWFPWAPLAQPSREALERERDYLRRQLEDIERRLRELEGGK